MAETVWTTDVSTTDHIYSDRLLCEALRSIGITTDYLVRNADHLILRLLLVHLVL